MIKAGSGESRTISVRWIDSGYSYYNLLALKFSGFLFYAMDLSSQNDECYYLLSAEFILLIKYSLSTGFRMISPYFISGNMLVNSFAISRADTNIILVSGLNVFIVLNSWSPFNLGILTSKTTSW